MKLSPISVPYKVLQRATGLGILFVFLVSAGTIQITELAFVVLGLVALALVVLAYEVAYYQRYTYELTSDTLDIGSGVVSRREREIPYRRIQNVDISQNILQRILGIAAVNVETAGGSTTEAAIRYVSKEAAKDLQRDVRQRKRRVADDREAVEDPEEEQIDPETGEPIDRPSRAPAQEPEELFAIEPTELALVGILSFDPRVPALIIALLTGAIPFVSPALPTTESTIVLALLVLVIGVAIISLSWIVGAVSSIINYWDFRLTRTEEELQYERGLLQRYSGSIPFDKIQTVAIEDNPLKRQFGYATLAVETAGYAPGQASGRGSEAAVPLATEERVYRLAHELEEFGDPEFTRPPKRIRWRYVKRYLLAIGGLTAIGYAVSWYFGTAFPWYLPVAAALLSPFAGHYKWIHRGYWLGEDHFVTRNGFWNRSAKVVPYYRTQTVIDRRTVFQRRYDVGTVIADTAGSLSLLGNDAAAVDMEDEEIEHLREELNDRLQASLSDLEAEPGSMATFEWVSDVDDSAEDAEASIDEVDDVDDTHDVDDSQDTDEEVSTDGEHDRFEDSDGSSGYDDVGSESRNT